jgi:hypothetical protein
MIKKIEKPRFKGLFWFWRWSGWISFYLTTTKFSLFFVPTQGTFGFYCIFVPKDEKHCSIKDVKRALGEAKQK